ncbi:Hypothetical protein PHPALM_17984 [Phytophthora palmivora]|uniref:Uncharacterized protein n=1 Tax=Phytophthora palmivora TaxID=4796 RepID=A0A2P4XKY2_9STRA|nr:Hypothetical protein PHPALM_17984 [Phytophthora palmivora]
MCPATQVIVIARRAKKNAKELDLQPFKPTSGGVRVETWIAKVDLVVEGACNSTRVDLNDEELYFVVRSKLQDDASKSLSGHERTRTQLKETSIRRNGERPDLAQVEPRVMQRTMQPGETFDDFASGLRAAAGQNQVREETLLGQFYRGLEKTARQLVKRAPTPSTLGEAVDKATRIDDFSYNVAKGMRNIGQPWATATAQTAVQMDSTTGAMRYAYFANPQGVFDKNNNVWVTPSGRTWNGKFWRLNKKGRDRERKLATYDPRPMTKRHSGKTERKAKAMMAARESSSSAESDEPQSPPRKKAVRPTCDKPKRPNEL